MSTALLLPDRVMGDHSLLPRNVKPAEVKDFLDRVSEGDLHTVAARAVFDQRMTATKLRRLARRDETFRSVYADAIEDGIYSRSLLADERADEIANAEEPQPTILLAWLRRWQPAFRDPHRVEMTGPGGGPLEVTSDIADAVDRFTAAVVSLATSPGAGSVDGGAAGNGEGAARLPLGRMDGPSGANGSTG